MAYPIQWLDATFNSRTTTEAHLRPDLEAGLITPHDYQLAATFLPGAHRYWPHGYALVGSTAVAGYARYYRRPPVSYNRTSILATIGGFAGAVYGQYRRAKAHWTFTQLLEDPVSFSQALENVNQRTGGVRPLAWTLQRAKEVSRTEDIHGDTSRPVELTDWTPGVEQAGAQPGPAPARAAPASPPSDAGPKARSRWEEIRAANARSTGQSSWDALRQGHERRRIPEAARNDAQRPEESSRGQEQAQFDALLEAERRVAAG